MPDILDELFTTAVINRLKAQTNPSSTLSQRIAILTAAENPDAPLSERCWQRILLARRAAWVSYVMSMRDAGFLDADVTARLTSVDDDGFRSALSECLTAHFLRHVLHLDVFGRHEGRPGKVLDFGLRRADGDLSVEVKSPFADRPAGSMWSGTSVLTISSRRDRTKSLPQPDSAKRTPTNKPAIRMPTHSYSLRSTEPERPARHVCSYCGVDRWSGPARSLG